MKTSIFDLCFNHLLRFTERYEQYMKSYHQKFEDMGKEKVELEMEGVTFQPELSKNTIRMFKNAAKSVILIGFYILIDH